VDREIALVRAIVETADTDRHVVTAVLLALVGPKTRTVAL
jgi:hypothetical protein